MYTAGTEGKKNAHFFLSFSLYHPSTCIRVTPTRPNSLRAQSPTATVGSFRTADYTYTSVDDCNTVSRIKQQRRRQHLATPKTFLSHDSAIRKINRKITSMAITSLPKRLDQHIVAYCWVTRCCHERRRCSVYGSIDKFYAGTHVPITLKLPDICVDKSDNVIQPPQCEMCYHLCSPQGVATLRSGIKMK